MSTATQITYTSKNNSLMDKFLKENSEAVERTRALFEKISGPTKNGTIELNFFKVKVPGEMPSEVSEDMTDYEEVVAYNFSDYLVNREYSKRVLLVEIK